MIEHIFPPEAQDVVQYIRENVPRPEELPKPKWGRGGTHLRFLYYAGINKCPMGMIETAKATAPIRLDDFEKNSVPFTDNEMYHFYRTWDSFKDPQSAVDAVWGETVKKEIEDDIT